MDLMILDKIKRIVIISLVEDDYLLDTLVLKGGNAINMIYNLSNRSSIDLDYSISEDFNTLKLEYVKNTIQTILTSNFRAEGYFLFDYKFETKPKKVNQTIKDFWGGYRIEFKLITMELYEKKKDNPDDLRRYAIPLSNNGSPKYEIDISKYEFCDGKIQHKMEGLVLYAYSPEMIVIEKLRAICQQIPDYKKLVPISTKSRARDFFDITILVDHFGINLNTRENIDLLENIFRAKKVPLEYLLQIDEIKEAQSSGFESVRQTVNQNENLQDFEYYFDFVKDLINKLAVLDSFRII